MSVTREAGHPLVDVFVSEQDVSGSVVKSAVTSQPYAAQGDRGWNVQTELRASAISLGIAAMQIFVFFDAGHVWNSIAEAGEVNNASLASVGAGFRFQVGRFVSVCGTYGFSH